jgi:hypothetical protein
VACLSSCYRSRETLTSYARLVFFWAIRALLYKPSGFIVGLCDEFTTILDNFLTRIYSPTNTSSSTIASTLAEIPAVRNPVMSKTAGRSKKSRIRVEKENTHEVAGLPFYYAMIRYSLLRNYTIIYTERSMERRGSEGRDLSVTANLSSIVLPS